MVYRRTFFFLTFRFGLVILCEWFHMFRMNLWLLFYYAIERSISFNLLMSMNFMGNSFLKCLQIFLNVKKDKVVKWSEKKF